MQILFVISFDRCGGGLGFNETNGSRLEPLPEALARLSTRQALTSYICSLLRNEKLNMINRACLALFPAVFLLGLKFAIINALILMDYDMADRRANSRCHAFNTEIIFSGALGL
ncbi:hypothetical protein BG015_010798 [Linnemannia schmuckeri]|uniref:Uncharacterized protein n=1 Tax=Linnemannia schmuckeri TaxID=64567 RepID=A0A9P5RTY8_9FUNG|nr:hypothetical protein BG015_010798 [Linnemannia schmuckeri]